MGVKPKIAFLGVSEVGGEGEFASEILGVSELEGGDITCVLGGLGDFCVERRGRVKKAIFVIFEKSEKTEKIIFCLKSHGK